MHWREQAACIGMDFELFYGEQGDQPIEAMRICRGCPVRADCLEEALTFGPRIDGVWGGTTGIGRQRIRLGRSTRAQEMRHGDEIAAWRTEAERLAAEEPWLAGVARGGVGTAAALSGPAPTREA